MRTVSPIFAASGASAIAESLRPLEVRRLAEALDQIAALIAKTLSPMFAATTDAIVNARATDRTRALIELDRAAALVVKPKETTR